MLRELAIAGCLGMLLLMIASGIPSASRAEDLDPADDEVLLPESVSQSDAAEASASDTIETTQTVAVEEEPEPESSWPEQTPSDDAGPPPPPLGVRMGEPLDGGEVRLAYTFERTWFQDLDDGGRNRKLDQVVFPGSFYQQAPTELKVTIHEFQLAYAPHPRITLVVDVPFIEKDLNRYGVDGRRHDHTKGIGDIDFFVIIPFIRKGREFSQIHLGVSAPTGSIRRGGDVKRLPYDNQIGNGSWDLEWGWTYRGERDLISWGAQIYGHHPIDHNSLHYREGSLFNASMWSALKVFKGLSTSLRLIAEKQNNIRGDDRSLDPAVDGPSSDSKKRGGFRLDISPGVTLEIPQLYNQRLSVEFGVPIYQDLDGPQLAQDWSLKAGWQWIF